jgi:hypothetical protein
MLKLKDYCGMSKNKEILKRTLALPFQEKIELILYPIFLLFRMPIAWCRALWSARILLWGQWSRYTGFFPRNAINSQFYLTQWINIDRHGRNGFSNTSGLGCYPIKNWFHLSSLASCFYANAGAVVTLSSTLLWALSHLIWIEATNMTWALLLSLMLLLSSTSYSMAFARQNYQMLGWIGLPMALFFAQQDQYVIASFALFAMGLFGVTPVFFAIPIFFTLAITKFNPSLVFILAPMLAFAAFRFLPLLFGGGVIEAVDGIAKLIGIKSSKVRYNREMKKFGLSNTYFLVLYTACAISLSFVTNEVAVLPFLACSLFLVNQRFCRVADEQSLYVVVASLFVFDALHAEPNWITAVILFLLLNPMAYFLSIQKKVFDRSIIVHAPFDHSALEKELFSFLEPVPSGESVYFAFDDPNGKYGNLFDGYRNTLEMPLKVAAKRNIHMFPDWWAVQETNYKEAPTCWGRSLQEIIFNCDYWGSNYVVWYQNTGSTLEDNLKTNFEQVAEFDFGLNQELYRNDALWNIDKPVPKWFLLHRLV